MGVVEEQLQQATCVHLRLREPRQSKEHADDSDTVNGVYWCQCTRDTLGPDGEEVDDGECTPFRSCYEPGND